MGVFFICIRRACGVECTLYCFRPLWGSFLFLFYNKRDIRPVFLKGFRPLWGSFLFVEYAAISNLNKNIVSVPSGDLFYLYITGYTVYWHSEAVSVPSGDLFYLYNLKYKYERMEL